jgi:large subunit ribosomal protein L24
MLGKKLHVKKGDTVVVISGKDKNKTGKILQLVPKKDGVLVAGLNVVKRHTRAKGNEAGGIIEKEAPVHISNVMVYCGKCKKAVRTRITVHEDGTKERLCVKCDESFDNK